MYASASAYIQNRTIQMKTEKMCGELQKKEENVHSRKKEIHTEIEAEQFVEKR